LAVAAMDQFIVAASLAVLGVVFAVYTAQSINPTLNKVQMNNGMKEMPIISCPAVCQDMQSISRYWWC
jgi:hypothetical protein